MANFLAYEILQPGASADQSGWCYHNDQCTLAQLLHSLPLNEAFWMAVQVNRLKYRMCYWFFGARNHVELNTTQYKSSSYLEASSCLSLTFLMVPVSSEMSILTLYCRMADLLLLNTSFKQIRYWSTVRSLSLNRLLGNEMMVKNIYFNFNKNITILQLLSDLTILIFLRFHFLIFNKTPNTESHQNCTAILFFIQRQMFIP